MKITLHIREIRKARGMTRRELADMAGVTYRTLHLHENNQRIPYGYTLCALAKVLGCTLNDLVTIE